MSIKGYKVFNPDWTCRGFQYKVGETFVHNGDIEMCGSGFHFAVKQVIASAITILIATIRLPKLRQSDLLKHEAINR